MGNGAFAALAGVSGGIRGGMEEHGRQKDRQQKERAITSREELEAAKREIQMMIAQLNTGSRERVAGMGADSRVEVAGIGAGSRENVATINQTGANARHATASGSVIENNRGAMDRLSKNIDFGYDKVFTEEQGRNDRWATPSGNATLGSETTRRGQDVGASTARRGQDIGASTTRRGQDLSFDLGTTRDATTRRGQDNSLSLGTERNKILKKKGSIYDKPPEDINLPVETPAPARGPIPMVPRGGGLPVPQDVSDADLDALAKSILVSQGHAATPANIKTFRDRNRDALIQQIKTVRAGGGG